MKRRAPKVNQAKSARDREPSGIAGPTRKRPRPKSLVAGHSGPHTRFPKALDGTDRPLAGKAQKPVGRESTVREKKEPKSPQGDQRARPKTSPRRNVARVPKPIVTVFGRRLTPHPKPRT